MGSGPTLPLVGMVCAGCCYAATHRMQLSEVSEPLKVKLENLMLLSTSGPPHLVLIDLGVAETQLASNSVTLYLEERAGRPD